MNERLRLNVKPGYPPDNIANTLRDLIYRATTVTPLPAAGSDEARLRLAKQHYMTWHEDIETHFGAMSADHDPMRLLTWERHWRIVATDDAVVGTRLISREVTDLVRRLEAIKADFTARRVFAERDPAATIVVPDTNVFLEFKPITDLDWLKLVPAQAVRLVVVGGVLDELDDWKFRRDRPPRPERARQALRLIDEKLEAGSSVRRGTTLDVLTEPEERATTGDSGIRRDALELKSLVGRQVHIATGDHGMRDRARSLGLGVVWLDQREHARSPIDA